MKPAHGGCSFQNSATTSLAQAVARRSVCRSSPNRGAVVSRALGLWKLALFGPTGAACRLPMAKLVVITFGEMSVSLMRAKHEMYEDGVNGARVTAQKLFPFVKACLCCTLRHHRHSRRHQELRSSASLSSPLSFLSHNACTWSLARPLHR